MSLPEQIKFNKHDCTLLLQLPSFEIPSQIIAIGDENNLKVKPEFHISVVASDNARRVYALVEEFQQFSETLQNLETLAHAQDWEYTRLGRYSMHEETYSREELLRVGKSDIPAHVRRTIIEQVDMPGIEKYYEGLAGLFGPNFAPPLTHVTVCSWSDFTPLTFRGISISTPEDYKRTLLREF